MKHKVSFEDRVTAAFVPAVAWECSCGEAGGVAVAHKAFAKRVSRSGTRTARA